MDHRLQDGLVFEPRTRPPPAYRLLLLNVASGAAPTDVAATLDDVTTMLSELAAGRVRELEGQPKEHADATARQFAGLRTLIGYGARFFETDVHKPHLTHAARPQYLTYLADDGPFPALRWANGATKDAEADVALQLTADTAAAVNCAAVECWKLVEDERLPLSVVGTFSGFGRDDGRGWLEFHDGVSNIESSQRLVALEAGADPPWMTRGTYMAYLRLVIDLGSWRALDRADQELIVGRDKLSGAALIRSERVGGRAVPVAATAPDANATAEESAAWRDPPQTTDPLVEESHIHRANQNRASPNAAAGLRMFRQGFDYFEGFDEGVPRVGLNFVSFQADLRTFQHVLHLPAWLGDANFGGPSQPKDGEPDAPPLVGVLAGGFYAVPPRGDSFPGSTLFG